MLKNFELMFEEVKAGKQIYKAHLGKSTFSQRNTGQRKASPRFIVNANDILSLNKLIKIVLVFTLNGSPAQNMV